MTEAPDERRDIIFRAAFFVLLWFAATFFFFGDLGKWMDDWAFHARNPVSDTVEWGRVLSLDPLNTKFWRPFHIHAAIALQSVFWHNDWATHLVLAVVHGINAWLLWKVLGRFCAGKRAPALGALVFLVYPAGHEAVFWNSTIGTGVGVWWLLACTLAVQRYAAGETGRGRLLLFTPLLLTLAWWYEQAAACAPALAAAYLACAPAGRPVRRRMFDAGWIAGAALLAGVVYAALMVLTMPPRARGSAGMLVGSGELVAHARLVFTQAQGYLTLSNFVPGALSEGWRALRSRPVESVGLGVALGVAAIGFGSWWMRGRSTPSAPGAGHRIGNTARQGTWWAVAYGVGIVAASFVPVIAVRDQWFAPRLAYTPLLGFVVVLAMLLDRLLGASCSDAKDLTGRLVRGTALVLLLPALALGTLMFVGVQSVWHARASLDRRVAAGLVKAFPSPPHGTLFIPAQVRARAVRTGSSTFDQIATGPLEFSWSAPSFVRFAYRRDDLHAVPHHSWFPPGHQLRGVVGATDEGVLVDASILPAIERPVNARGWKLVPWSQTVVFRLLKSGVVRPADSVRALDDDEPSLDRVVRSVPGRPTAGWSALIAAPPDPLRRLVRPDWKLVGPDGRPPSDQAAPAEHGARGRSFSAFILHPSVGTINDRSELRATLAGSGAERQLSMRAVLLDQTIGQSDGVTVSVELVGPGDDAGAVLAQESITHERLSKERGWIVVRATIPPSSGPRQCRIVTRPGPAENSNADWCCITPPVVAERAAGAPSEH